MGSMWYFSLDWVLQYDASSSELALEQVDNGDGLDHREGPDRFDLDDGGQACVEKFYAG